MTNVKKCEQACLDSKTLPNHIFEFYIINVRQVTVWWCQPSTNFYFYSDPPTPCTGEENCTTVDENSHCNTDTNVCECNKEFTADGASNKCVKGMYHNDKISIWKYYPQTSCTHFNFYLDTTSTCNDEDCSEADANSVCNTTTGACECNTGFTADMNSGICVEGIYHNDKVLI